MNYVEYMKKNFGTLQIEGQFCHPDSNISPDIFYHDIYKKIDMSKVTKPIAHCNGFGKKKPIYLSELENFFNDDIEWGTHFEGIICISLTEKQINKLAINGFDSDDIDLPEVLEVNINGIVLDFFPYQYLY